jgi:hypothetical protein
MGAMPLGNVDILVHSRPKVARYFSIPLPNPPVRWRRAWFLLRNDANALLPTFMGGRPIPHANWEFSVTRADLHRQQPLLEIIWGLLQWGLTSAKILRTFFQPWGSAVGSNPCWRTHVTAIL